VDSIETTGGSSRQVQHFCGFDAELILLKNLNDVSDVALFDAIGFDDG
jgi:hypothetical protein